METNHEPTLIVTTLTTAAGKGKGKGKGKEIPPPVASTNSDKNGPKLPLLAVDLSIVPALRTRVALAKKIFTQSFVVSKRTKEQSWLRQSANEADLEMDDFAKEEYEGGCYPTHVLLSLYSRAVVTLLPCYLLLITLTSDFEVYNL